MINYEVIIIIVLIFIILYFLINKPDFKRNESFKCYCPPNDWDRKLMCDGQYFNNECQASCRRKDLSKCKYYYEKLDRYL